MDETQYYEWDYTTRTVIQYERQGECNGCGACCKAHIEFRTSIRPDLPPNVRMEGDPEPREGGAYTTGKGIWSEVRLPDGRRRFFEVYEIKPDTGRCSQLGEDNKCTMHLSKLLICSGWPFAPSQVAPFPECSYSFVEVGRWNISEATDEQ